MTPVLGAEIEAFRYADAAGDALSGVGLEFASGALVGIVGAAGSGKSTLGAVAAGLLPRAMHGAVQGAEDGGHDGDRLTARLDIAGQRLVFGPGAAPRIDVAAWARRVAMLPQDARHYLSGVRATVREELAFGLENAGVPRARMVAAVDAAADELGIVGLLDASPERISGGQERLVAIAALAVTGPAAVILDEPLAGLDAHARAEVGGLIARLRARGTAVVALAAEYDELIRAADAVHVLSGGRTVATGAPGEVRAAAGQHGVLIGAEPPERSTRGAAGEVLLEFEGVRLRHRGAAEPAVDGFDLRVAAGCCTALLGPNGAGKTTVLKAAAGLLAPEAGRVRAEGAGLLLQNPADQLFERTVEREVGFGLPGGRRNPAVAEVLGRLGLAAVAGTHPYELPASQARLVALASVLARRPRVLLLDEPTVALDAAGRRRLLDAVRDSRRRGSAVLVSTHDEDFAAAVAQEDVRLAGRGGRPVGA